MLILQPDEGGRRCGWDVFNANGLDVFGQEGMLDQRLRNDSHAEMGSYQSEQQCNIRAFGYNMRLHILFGESHLNRIMDA